MRLLLCAAALASIAAAPAAMGADTLYKWVDKNGNVTYQDEPPPANSGQVETMVESGNTAAQSALPNVKVVLYSIKVCDACDLVRHILQERGVPFEEKNAEGNAKVQDELKKVAGVLSVPVLTIGKEVLTGYDKALILKDLKDAGFSKTAKAQEQQGNQQGEQAQEGQGDGQSQQGQQVQGDQRGDQPLTRQDLQGMTPEEIQQAYRDAISRKQDNDLFQQDQGFVTDDPTPNSDLPPEPPNDITDLQEIPKDEQIKVNQ
ncbi:MAG: glutaredoxin family protein [Arenicellales bacterium]